ncbi:MAG: hypothetical protein ACR2KV_14365 [Solirubrobacteraceae bacterium]
MGGAADSNLSDEEFYARFVRAWTGFPPALDWPCQAPAIARRCAIVLAARGPCEFITVLRIPTGASVDVAREAVIDDLQLTPGGLLAVLADHWEQLAPLEMPLDDEPSLLGFARHVLLEPVAGGCAYMWAMLHLTSRDFLDPPTAYDAPMGAWQGWSPVWGDEWSSVVASELVRLGRPTPHLPDDADEGAMTLAAARAAVLGTRDDVAQIAASIVRTSGWPGDTTNIAPLARLAVELARRRLSDIDRQTDNHELIESIQPNLIPQKEVLLAWIRDPSFGALVDPADCSNTGAEMLEAAVHWLTWILARAAVEVFAAARQPTATSP